MKKLKNSNSKTGFKLVFNREVIAELSLSTLKGVYGATAEAGCATQKSRNCISD